MKLKNTLGLVISAVINDRPYSDVCNCNIVKDHLVVGGADVHWIAKNWGAHLENFPEVYPTPSLESFYKGFELKFVKDSLSQILVNHKPVVTLGGGGLFPIDLPPTYEDEFILPLHLASWWNTRFKETETIFEKLDGVLTYPEDSQPVQFPLPFSPPKSKKR